MIPIRIVAVLTAFLSGTLLGIVLSEIRARRGRQEEQALQVANALADDAQTVLVDDAQLPSPSDERWALTTVQTTRRVNLDVLSIGAVLVSVGAKMRGTVYVSGLRLQPSPAVKNYAIAVWRAHQTRVTLAAVK